MIYRKSTSRKVFDVFNIIFLVTASLFCLLPFFNLLAISFSEGAYASAGKVTFWPMGFTTSAYKFILNSPVFMRSLFISFERVILGVIINIFVIVITAYPLSKSGRTFKSRGFYSWFFIISMLFTPSLIPSYIVVKNLNLMNSIGALILPGALPIFSMIVMLNFFRNLPNELDEAAFIDGANHWTILWKIYIPLSKPSIATVALFCIVTHWNSWFDGLIYMNDPANYPLQSYLQTVIINPDTLIRTMQNNPELAKLLGSVNNKTAKAAQLFIAALPVLVAYPFLQKYFTTGLTLGSVKE